MSAAASSALAVVEAGLSTRGRAAALLLALAALAPLARLRRRTQPGKLAPRRTFVQEDPASAGEVDGRRSILCACLRRRPLPGQLAPDPAKAVAVEERRSGLTCLRRRPLPGKLAPDPAKAGAVEERRSGPVAWLWRRPLPGKLAPDPANAGEVDEGSSGLVAWFRRRPLPGRLPTAPPSAGAVDELRSGLVAWLRRRPLPGTSAPDQANAGEVDELRSGLVAWLWRRPLPGRLATEPASAGAVDERRSVLLAWLWRQPLPGKLVPRGTFLHEDPAHTGAVDERRRDFARIVGTKRHIWVLTDSGRKPGTALPIDLTYTGSTNVDLGQLALQKLQFWMQGELGKLPGAADVASTAQRAIVDRVIYFVSASPGFDFLMQNEVPPMILQAKYLLMISKTGQVRVAWYAFVSDKVVPGATTGPYIVKLVSEDLSAGRGHRTHTECSYTARRTRETDMEKAVARDVPLAARAIDADLWDAYLNA